MSRILIIVLLSPIFLRAQSLLPNASEMKLIEVYKDTDAIETRYGSTVRAHGIVEGMEGLGEVRVRDASGNRIDHSTSWTVLYGVPRGTAPAVVQAQLQDIRDAFAKAHPEAVSIKVRPIYVSGEKISERAAQAVEWSRGPLQWAGHHLARVALVGARRLKQSGYQILLLGSAVALFRVASVSSQLTSPAVLAQDWLYVGMALTLSLPLEVAWGMVPSTVFKIKNDWPRYLGIKKLIPPLLATAIFDMVGYLLYSGSLRQITFWAQQSHPELVTDGAAKAVESAFSKDFVGSFLGVRGLGWIGYAAAGTAIRKAHVKGWINKWAENILYHIINIESQETLLMLASHPALIPVYAPVSHGIKAGMWLLATLLPAKRGRAVVFEKSLSDEVKQDIFNRVGIPINTFGQVDPQFVQDIQASEAGYSMSLPEGSKLRKSTCEASWVSPSSTSE